MDIAETNTTNKVEYWTCQTCTLINNVNNEECIACGTSKNGGTANSTAIWTCEYCTTFNISAFPSSVVENTCPKNDFLLISLTSCKISIICIVSFLWRCYTLITSQV